MIIKYGIIWKQFQGFIFGIFFMNLERVDLNLLIYLDVLLREKMLRAQPNSLG